MSRLLINENPLQVLPTLACTIGLNEAIVLQQIHYWLNSSQNFFENRHWVYNSVTDWQEQFPFWSESTIKRVLANLEKLNVVFTGNFNSDAWDKTKWYSINYAQLCKIEETTFPVANRLGQVDPIEEVNVTQASGQVDPCAKVKMTQSLTENTTEITTENKNTFRPEASQPDPQTAEQDFLIRNPDAVVFSAKKRQWGSREDLACAQWIWGRIVNLYEQAASDDGEIMRPKEPNWTAWANDVRTMRMLDGRSYRQICEMFGRVQRDPFWVKNIMSPSKLREKWDELVIRLGRSPVQRCVNHISEPDTEIPPGFRG